MTETRRCSSPGCTDPAEWKATAQDAGTATGKTFYTCDRHGRETDDRRPVADGRDVVVLRESPPMMRSMFGEYIAVPEFVTATCDACGASGSLHEDAARTADVLVCAAHAPADESGDS